MMLKICVTGLHFEIGAAVPDRAVKLKEAGSAISYVLQLIDA